MPHSSGGGSHSGGSFSGSSHSHSSGGGSHSGGSSSAYRSIRVSSRPFRGAHRYIRYDRHGYGRYIYTNGKVTDSKINYFLIPFYLIFIIFILYSMIGSAIHIPRRITEQYTDEIIIRDEADVMTTEEEQALAESLEKFQKKTGITPVVETYNTLQHPEIGSYDSLSVYAYDLYVNQFSDEDHWLIIYCTDKGTDWEDWQFEGMQGDNTDSILTPSRTDKFNNSTTHYLMARSQYSVAQAFSLSFDELTDTAMMPYVNGCGIFSGLVGLSFILCHAYVTMGFPEVVKKKKFESEGSRKTTPAPVMTPVYRCEYCGSLYTEDIAQKENMTCPHCGAPVTWAKDKNAAYRAAS